MWDAVGSQNNSKMLNIEKKNLEKLQKVALGNNNMVCKGTCIDTYIKKTIKLSSNFGVGVGFVNLVSSTVLSQSIIAVSCYWGSFSVKLYTYSSKYNYTMLTTVT